MRIYFLYEIITSFKLLLVVIFLLITFLCLFFLFFLDNKPEFIQSTLSKWDSVKFYLNFFDDFFLDFIVFLRRFYYDRTTLQYFLGTFIFGPFVFIYRVFMSEFLSGFRAKLLELFMGVLGIGIMHLFDEIFWKIPQRAFALMLFLNKLLTFEGEIVIPDILLREYCGGNPELFIKRFPTLYFSIVIANLIHYILSYFISSVYIAPKTVFLVIAFGAIFISFFFFLYIGSYTRLLIFLHTFKYFCLKHMLTFAKTSLFFVPVSALVYKRRKFWNSDAEINLKDNYRTGKQSRIPLHWTDLFDSRTFSARIKTKEAKILENLASSNKVVLTDNFFENINNDIPFAFFKDWLKKTPFKKKNIPLAIIGSDTTQGVAEKNFVKLVWINDIVVTKVLVNRLNYSSIFCADNVIATDPVVTQNPLCHSILYCENILLSKRNQASFKVTKDLRISIRPSYNSSWVDLDYSQYAHQFVLSRVFNKLQFSGLNSVISSDSVKESSVGTRSAVYKVYTPDLLARNVTNTLNNPFVNSDIFDLFSSGLKPKKGHSVSLGKLTDVVLLLKSIRTQYRTLHCFKESDVVSFNTKYRFPTLQKNNKKLTLLELDLAFKQTYNFNLTAPFSFLLYSHVHYMTYETRPDRFYLLPSSINLLIRPFLTRLLSRFAKQVLKINALFLVRKNKFNQEYLLDGSNQQLTVLSKIEYVLYKFFANKNYFFKENKKNSISTAAVQASSFDFLSVEQNTKRTLDLLFTLDKLLHTVDLPIFELRILSLIYNPLESSFLKLINFFFKNENISSFQSCIFGLFINILDLKNTNKFRSLFTLNTISKEIYMLLLWRAVLKSLQQAFVYFLPKNLFKYSYNSLVTKDNLFKNIGGLDLFARYKHGILESKNYKFLHKFTAVYNRNLTRIRFKGLVDRTALPLSNNNNTQQFFSNDFLVDSNIFLTKDTTCFIWWWLKKGAIFRVDYYQQLGYKKIDPFFYKKNFSFSLLDFSLNTTSLESLNFAALAYDSSGTLGVKNILPTERFLSSQRISALDQKFNDLHAMMDFIPQKTLRKKLQHIAGSDDNQIQNLILERKLEMEDPKNKEEKFIPLDFNDVFGRSRFELFFRPGMVGKFPGDIHKFPVEDKDSGIPKRFWNLFYYNEFISCFFEAFTYAKFGRTRLYYKSAALNPLTPLLLLFKKQRSIIFFKNKKNTLHNADSFSNYKKFLRKSINNNKNFKQQAFARRKFFKSCKRLVTNKVFKNILLHFFSKTFYKNENKSLSRIFELGDFFGGFENRQRSLFRSTITTLFNTEKKPQQEFLKIKNKSDFSNGLTYKLSKYKKLAVTIKKKILHNLPIETDLRTFSKNNTIRQNLLLTLKKTVTKQKSTEVQSLSKLVSQLVKKSSTKEEEGFYKINFKKLKTLAAIYNKPKRTKNLLIRNRHKRLFKLTWLQAELLNRKNRRETRIKNAFVAGKIMSDTSVAGVRRLHGTVVQDNLFQDKNSLKGPLNFGFFLYPRTFGRFKQVISKYKSIMFSNAKQAVVQKANKQQIGDDSLEFCNLLEEAKQAPLGVNNLQKNTNFFANYFLSKTNRKNNFLKTILKFKNSNSLELSVFIDNNEKLHVATKLKRDNLLKILFIIKQQELNKNKELFGLFKDIFLFRNLSISKGFLCNEYSFEESFFSLLGQRVPLIKNPILLKPISRSALFNFDFLQKQNICVKTKSLQTNQFNYNFSSVTLANSVFFNYITLGQGVFFNTSVVGLGSAKTGDARFMLWQKRAYEAFFNLTVKIKNSAFKINKEVKPKQQVGPKPKRIKNRLFSDKELFVTHEFPRATRNYFKMGYSEIVKKIPFFIRYPFKIVQKVRDKKGYISLGFIKDELRKKAREQYGWVMPPDMVIYNKHGLRKKLKIVETQELKILRNLFFQNKLSFFNLSINFFMLLNFPKFNKKVGKTSTSILLSKFYKRNSLRSKIRETLFGVFLQKPNQKEINLYGFGRKMQLYFRLYKKYNYLEDYVNWKVAAPVNKIKTWIRSLENSTNSLVFQKTIFLRQFKKNIINAGLFYKFSPISFDLRSQVPIRSFVRQQRLQVKKKFLLKKIEENPVREADEFYDPVADPTYLRIFKGRPLFQRGLYLKYLWNKNRKLFLKQSNQNKPEQDTNLFNFNRYAGGPGSVINNEKRNYLLNRTNLLQRRVSESLLKKKVKIFKNIPTQTAFKRSVAASIRFCSLSLNSVYRVSQLHEALLEKSFLATSTNNSIHKLIRVSTSRVKLNNKSAGSKDTSIIVNEYKNQKTNFEKAEFRLAFISELITRKFLINKPKTPSWIFNWILKEGRTLLYKYVAYKKHNFTVLPQVQHTAVPNSSGIHKLGAAFDLFLNKNILFETIKTDFYKPMFVKPYLNYFAQSTKNKRYVSDKLVTKVQDEFIQNISPTTYDLLLSKAVKSFFVTKGVRRELQKKSWHKTEYCYSIKNGWLLPIWTSKTFKRSNFINFISLKKNEFNSQTCLGLSSLNKQLTITNADGFFYFLLLNEKSNVSLLAAKTNKKEPLLEGFERQFKILSTKGLNFQQKGFCSIIPQNLIPTLKDDLVHGPGVEVLMFAKSRRAPYRLDAVSYGTRERGKKGTRVLHTKNFRELKHKFFRKEKIKYGIKNKSYHSYHSKKTTTNDFDKDALVNFEYSFKGRGASFINFLFFIHFLCYQRVLRKLSRTWNESVYTTLFNSDLENLDFLKEDYETYNTYNSNFRKKVKRRVTDSDVKHFDNFPQLTIRETPKFFLPRKHKIDRERLTFEEEDLLIEKERKDRNIKYTYNNKA